MRLPSLSHAAQSALSLGSVSEVAIDAEHLQTMRGYIDEIAVGHGVSLESVAEAWADKRGLTAIDGLRVLDELLKRGEYFIADDAIRTVRKRMP